MLTFLLKPALLTGTAMILGIGAGVGDRLDLGVGPILGLLALSGLALGLWAPRHWLALALAVALGVLAGHLALPAPSPPPGLEGIPALATLDRGLIAAGTATLPASVGALAGACLGWLARPPRQGRS